MMEADSANPNCAYMWLEHSLSPKVQGDVSAWFGSLPVVPAACKGNELLTDEGCKTNGYDNFEKIKFWKTPVSKCATQNDQCVPYYRWVSDYIGVIGGR
jgi:putative spermidine/putrescine transport system substrate-binding protein